MPFVHITWLPKTCRTAAMRKEVADAVIKVRTNGDGVMAVIGYSILKPVSSNRYYSPVVLQPVQAWQGMACVLRTDNGEVRV